MIRSRCAVILAAAALACAAGCAIEIDAAGDSREGANGQDGGAAGDAAPPDDCPRARVVVAAGQTLRVRDLPSTQGAVVGSLPNNAVVTVTDRVTGEEVSGNAEWLQIDAPAGFVSGAFAMCTTDEAPALEPPGGFRLPLECGTSARISQGNAGSTSHSGKALYAFDFAIPLDTPLVAMADGVVLFTFAETGPGDPCYDGGGSSCFPYANYVVLEHGDGTGSIYKHLNQVLVTVGELVPSGAPVGLSGSTGYSTGPHAHVMRQEECGAATSCQSIQVTFADVGGDGIPDTGETVTSGNCD